MQTVETLHATSDLGLHCLPYVPQKGCKAYTGLPGTGGGDLSS